MIQAFAWGLEVGHPFAYFLIFMLIGIPIIGIVTWVGCDIIDKWKEKRKKND